MNPAHVDADLDASVEDSLGDVCVDLNHVAVVRHDGLQQSCTRRSVPERGAITKLSDEIDDEWSGNQTLIALVDTPKQSAFADCTHC